MDNKQRLFELIRREDVIIWAGAGLSLYAGYPSGKKLKEILFDSLLNSEKAEISESLPLSLPDFAEEYYRIKGNDMSSLIQVLNDTFVDFVPSSTSCHDNIASIPHFKTIITTNYDRLFENSYDSKAQVIFSEKQIPSVQKKKVQIFKVHGDLTELKTIIIKNSDYEHFFQMGFENDILWTSIKDRIATNSVLFLGYNLEDSNTRVLFDRITRILGKDRRECFMVAPNLSRAKLSDLKAKNIHYIDLKAEIFIDELITNIKKNIFTDTNNHLVSVETSKTFVINHNVIPEYQVDSVDGLFKLHSLRGKNGTQGELKLKIKGDKTFATKFNDFLLGKLVGEFEFNSKNLVNVNFNIGGIKWPLEGENLVLKLKSHPKRIDKIDVEFEDGFEITDLLIQLFGNYPLPEVHTKYKTAQFKIKFDFSNLPKVNVDFQFEHHDFCKSLKDELDVANLLKNLSHGKRITIFWDLGKKNISKRLPKSKKMQKEANFLIEYFKKLKLIERHFKIRFGSFPYNSITEDSYKTVKEITSVIKNEKLKYVWDGEQHADLFDLSKETLESFSENNFKKSPILVCIQDKEEVLLHGQKFFLGYKKIEIVEPCIKNLEEVLKSETKILKVVSEAKEVRVFYTDKKEL
tara:strand:+ start:38942 stop:40840 length:1899 start_codon:yes stop_codon:yes gene_type:complete